MKDIRLLAVMLIFTFAATFSVSAQDVVFTSLSGNKIDVETQKGKVVVMGIGASWLPLSDDQSDTINKLVRKYVGRKDIVFYFIATDSSLKKSKNYASDDDIRKFAKRNRLKVTILRDNEGKTSIQRYKLNQLPAFIILDKMGKPDGESISGIDPLSEVDTVEILSKRINKLL